MWSSIVLLYLNFEVVQDPQILVWYSVSNKELFDFIYDSPEEWKTWFFLFVAVSSLIIVLNMAGVTYFEFPIRLNTLKDHLQISQVN